MRYAIDIETNGLLRELNKIHCVAIVGIDNDFKDLLLEDRLIELLYLQGHELIFHNGFQFDLVAIKKIIGVDLSLKNKIYDTMVSSQVLFGNLTDLDFSLFKISTKLLGSHSLVAWGERLNCLKNNYDKGWEEYSDEMGKYCLQDAEVTKQLYLYQQSKIAERTWK